VAGLFLGSRWFADRTVVSRWFLHMHDPPLGDAAFPSP
jgi:hypothetical protein